MDFFIFVAVLVGFVAFVSFVKANAKKKRVAAWTLAAEALSLMYDGEKISGMVGGVALSVQVEVRGSGKSRTEYTVFILRLADNLPAGLWIAAEGFLSKVTKYLGSQDVQLGIPELDPKLMVKGKNEDEIRQWAQQSHITQSLSELALLSDGTYQIAAGELRYEYGDVISDAVALEGRIRSLTSIAAGLSAPECGASSVDDDEGEEVLW